MISDQSEYVNRTSLLRKTPVEKASRRPRNHSGTRSGRRDGFYRPCPFPSPRRLFGASQTRIQAFLQQQQTQSGCFCKLHASTHDETFIFVASHNLPLPNAHYPIVHFHFHFHFLRMSVGCLQINVTQQI